MIFTFLFLFITSAQAASYEDASDFFKKTDDYKALVFLSKDCPCSKSHVSHLNELQQEFKAIPLYGVIADLADEKEIASYFNSKNISFPLISDPQQKLVKQFKALKTPHVVLLKKQPNNQYSVIYEGGVSDQRDGAKAKTFFLKENLLALQNNKPLPYAQGKSLGCYIRRL